MTEAPALALGLAGALRDAVVPALGRADSRRPAGRAPGGDVTLALDEIAEQVIEERLEREGDVAFYSEDRGLVTFGAPRFLLVIDPVDGTRPAAAGLESACVSIAVVPPSEDARLGDVSFGVVQELKSGARFWASRGQGARAVTASDAVIELAPSPNTDLGSLFFAIGTRRPMVSTSIVLEELSDGAGMTGACFNLGSATFDMTRVATGQLDAYVDVGRRVLDEQPRAESAFLALGEGTPCVNFPYDVAAATLIVEEAGGVVTQADGRPLHTQPAVGSSREHGLSVLAAANPVLHRALLEALDRGMVRLGDWLMGAESRGLL